MDQQVHSKIVSVKEDKAGRVRLQDAELNLRLQSEGPPQPTTEIDNVSQPWYTTTMREHIGMDEVHRAVCGFLAGTSTDETIVKREHIDCEPPMVAYDSQVVSTNSSQKSISKTITNHKSKTSLNAKTVVDMPTDSNVLVDTTIGEPSTWINDMIVIYREVDNSLVDTHFEHNGTMYKCKICPEKLCDRVDWIRNHVRQHVRIKPYRCTFRDCNKTFSATFSLKYHAKHHFPTMLQCSHCPKKFTKLHTWRHHQNVHTGNKPHKCKECDICFHTLIHRCNHTQSVHGDFKTTKQCDICGKIVPSPRFMAHIRDVHQKPPNQKCKRKICGSKYMGKISFDKHVLEHTPGEQFTCDTCSKCFNNRSWVIMHIRRHTDRFKCPKCDKIFSDKSFFQGHLRQHDSIKKHCCQVCGKRFTHVHYLTTHMKSHGEKNFVCEMCGGKFNQKDNLKSHIIRQHLSGVKKANKKKK